MQVLEFESQIAELESKIEELRHLASTGDVNIADEIQRLEKKQVRLLSDTYAKLTPWQKVLVARHSDRPHCVDYIQHLIEDFMPLAGDRAFAEDQAIIGGFGRFRGQTIMLIGQEKGHDMESRIKHNFGAPRPEGYRKAIRLMELADRYNVPVVTLVDTAGAYAGVAAEERGQAQAIAKSIETCLSIKVPLVSVIIGEGGSGGAIALASANEVYMLEHSIYSVISPESCATILWRSAEKKQLAAQAQKLSAQDLYKLKVIDGIIPEPLGGAHRYPKQVYEKVGDTIGASLKKMAKLSGDGVCAARRDRFLRLGEDL